jgi:regulator of sirC expression with transglutaminase-like and TPR domain
MTPASKLLAQDVRRRFGEAVSGPEASIDLASAALLIAAEEETRLDIKHYLTLLDQMAEAARAYAGGSRGVAVEAFNEFMFEEMSFAGDQLNYYDPRNSFLNHVIDRRTGIPITLSIIYMEIGRRAGLQVEGVGMPGHFIVRVHGGSSLESTLVDPFHGKTIGLEDCQDRLDAMYGGQVKLTQEHLRASTKREILARMLTNLKMIYVQAMLYRQALAVVERIQLLTPEAVGEHRDAASLLMQLDRLPEAIAATETYLRRAPKARDAKEVRERLHLLQRQQAMKN